MRMPKNFEKSAADAKSIWKLIVSKTFDKTEYWEWEIKIKLTLIRDSIELIKLITNKYLIEEL